MQSKAQWRLVGSENSHSRQLNYCSWFGAFVPVNVLIIWISTAVPLVADVGVHVVYIDIGSGTNQIKAR